MRRRSTVMLTAVMVGVGVAAGAGTAYAAHFQDRALPGSTLGGVSVAGLTRSEVAAAVEQRADDVIITVQTPEGTRGQTLADLGYSIDVDATVDAVFEANESWSSYARSLVVAREVDAVVRTDTSRTDAVVTDLVSRAGKVGKDARVELSDDGRSFEVVPAVQGHTIDAASFQDVVADSARHLTPATATVTFVDAEAAVTTAEAEQVADRANGLVGRTVQVSDGDETHKASRATKASWVRIPVSKGEPGSPTIDAAKVKAWVEKVARSTTVDPTAGVRNVSARGDVLAVFTDAHDGKVATNSAGVAAAAVKALTDGKDYRGRFEYKKIPAAWTDRRVAAGAEHLAYPAAEGEKWVDVNLSAHTMTAYVGAEVVYGPIKMVNGSDEKPTVVGTFHVYLQRESQTMRGSNADGTNYETPDVPYISYFHRGFALHGAPWRSSFGYAGARGSHGCINLPVPAARWVYGFADVGTTVVTHH